MQFGDFRYHNLKIDIEFWDDLESGRKVAEVRLNDRDYKVGDSLFFLPVKNGNYLEGDSNVIERKITHIVQGGQYGIEDGYCMLSMAKPEHVEINVLR